MRRWRAARRQLGPRLPPRAPARRSRGRRTAAAKTAAAQRQIRPAARAATVVPRMGILDARGEEGLGRLAGGAHASARRPGLLVFRAAVERPAAFDSRLAGSPNGVPEGELLTGGLNTPLPMPPRPRSRPSLP